MLSSGRWQGFFSQRDPVLAERSNATTIDEHTAGQFLQRHGLQQQARARLARELGDSFEEVGRLGAAAGVYQAALHLDPGTEGDERAREEVEQALTRVTLARSALARSIRARPVISKNLEQDRLVRPKGPMMGEAEGSL